LFMKARIIVLEFRVKTLLRPFQKLYNLITFKVSRDYKKPESNHTRQETVENERLLAPALTQQAASMLCNQ
jgi:hypothetical protein